MASPYMPGIIPEFTNSTTKPPPPPSAGAGTQSETALSDPGGALVESEDESLSSEDILLIDQMRVSYPWLNELGDDIFNLITSLLVQDMPAELIAAEIRRTPQYEARFPGMNARIQNGYDPITEAEYISLEASYTGLFRNFGISHFYNDAELKTNFTTFITNDVSPSEVSARLDKGYAAVTNSSVELAATFEEFYGIRPTDDALLMYFLDPDRGLVEIENQIATAVVGSQALKYGLNITRTRAEILQKAGVDESLAKTGFANTAKELPQLKRLAQIHQLNPISQTDLEDFFFHEDPDVGKNRFNIFQTALNEFQEGGLATRSREGGLSQFIDRDRAV